MWLAKNGIPFDVALALDDTMRTAWAIVFSEMEGNAFDWNAMRFKDEKD